jgi:glycosyltransferase involved in cell wall biosynthesis
MPVAVGLRIPLVCHFRSRVLGQRRILIRLLNMSDRVIAVSSAVKDCLIRAGVKDKKVVVVHNAVDVSLYEEGSAGGDMASIIEGPAIVGMASRLLPWKGHRFLLQAASRVIRTIPDVQFQIAGDARPDEDLYAAELLDMTRQLGLEGHVQFLGYQDDIAPFMKSIDVLVLPSDNEPFGRVLIEAMAAGKPVVAFQGGGAAEIVDSGSTGLLVAPGDPEGLARAIETLISDRALAKAMGKSGRARVETCFTVERHVSRVQALYRSILGVVG